MKYDIPINVANKIVNEFKNYLDTNFNFMDRTGYIIAAVDPDRVGKLHMGAKKVIDEDLDYLFVTEDMKLANTKEGINMAIKINGQTVGVLGITGSKEKIMQFAMIVRRMTEIMLEDYMYQEEVRLKRHIRYRFIEQWLKDPNPIYNPYLVEKASSLGIDLETKRRVVTITINKYDELNSTLDGQKIIDAIDDIVREFAEENENFIYLYLPSYYTILISSKETSFIPKLNDLHDKVKEEYSQNLRIGIDGNEIGSTILIDSYSQAINAMKIAEDKNSKIVFFNELIVENFLYDISRYRMNHYLDLFFENVKPEEIKEIINFVDLYFQKEGSIKEIASSLYVHNNTIQYRIQKLIDQTGYDIRKPSETIYFHLLLKFYKVSFGL